MGSPERETVLAYHILLVPLLLPALLLRPPGSWVSKMDPYISSLHCRDSKIPPGPHVRDSCPVTNDPSTLSPLTFYYPVSHEQTETSPYWLPSVWHCTGRRGGGYPMLPNSEVTSDWRKKFLSMEDRHHWSHVSLVQNPDDMMTSRMLTRPMYTQRRRLQNGRVRERSEVMSYMSP
ncbi:hypothetical protein DPEC_G00292350 [Dallia pectoralis]|uniref:Uncharacterized protein n=1 Tax=Dallia pectoralis TaxID=75939 RepID=A0ACC2FHV4_DALPE|nr:hypothetical protein DPEC_G00292350 [Dallia pectoralis]